MSFSVYDFDETLKGTSIERTEIKRVVAAYGVTEAGCCDDCGGEWSGGFLLELKSGKFAFVSGWCDYTGWGCQDGTGRVDFDCEPALETLDQGYTKKDWETTLPDLQRYIETGEGNWP
jgi:hypothetical protein